jgi:hypothetical protein
VSNDKERHEKSKIMAEEHSNSGFFTNDISGLSKATPHNFFHCLAKAKPMWGTPRSDWDGTLVTLTRQCC